jgi:hypothetical protein
MTTLRGAPFDENNLFNRDSVDGGKLKFRQSDNAFTRIDGGSFSNVPRTPSQVNDCGNLPKEGEATYVPDPDYTPTGPKVGI